MITEYKKINKKHKIKYFEYINTRGIDMEKIKKIIFFIVTLLIFIVPGFIFGMQTDFYKEINKPVFAPPGIVFSIVWTGLYTIQAYYIIKIFFDYKKTSEGKTIFWLLIINGIANILYMPIFFILKSLFGGFIITLILVVTLVLIIYKSKISNVKEWYLEIPYLLWSMFALVLSISIYLMN